MQHKCKTPGAIFHINISDRKVGVSVDLPFDMKLSDEEAIKLETKLHDAVESAIEQAYNKKQ